MCPEVQPKHICTVPVEGSRHNRSPYEQTRSTHYIYPRLLGNTPRVESTAPRVWSRANRPYAGEASIGATYPACTIILDPTAIQRILGILSLVCQTRAHTYYMIYVRTRRVSTIPFSEAHVKHVVLVVRIRSHRDMVNHPQP